MNKKFIYVLALVITALWPVHGFAQAPKCECKDLPLLVREVITQTFLTDLFTEWSRHPPEYFTDKNSTKSIEDGGDVTELAETILDFKLGINLDKSAVVPANKRAHAFLETTRDTCQIRIPQYEDHGNRTEMMEDYWVADPSGKIDKDGKPVQIKNQQLVPGYKVLVDKDYLASPSQCITLLQYPLAHEKKHVENCKNRNARDSKNLPRDTRKPPSDSEEAIIAKVRDFALDDAQAYKVGLDVLRKDTADLAKKCGWEGSAKPRIPMPVPTLARAQELADKAAAAIKQPPPSAPKPKPPTPGKPPKVIPIIVGAAIDNSPMDVLLQRWDQQCAKPTTTVTPNNCGSLVASIELSLLSLLREIRQNEPVPRAVLFNAAHAQFTQLKRYAMHALGSAQTPEEIDLALAATDHSAPAIRDAARTMLGSSNDPRWLAIQRWWKQDNNFKLSYQTLTPQVSPYPERYGVDSLEGLRHLPYASDAKSTFFTTPEAADKVIARLAKGKTIMANSEDVKKNSEKMQMEFPKLQQEIMAAALSGDTKKIQEITKKITDMQKNLMPADPYAINEDNTSTGILLRRDEKTMFPTSVVRVRRDAESGLTVVVFDVTPPPVLPQ